MKNNVYLPTCMKNISIDVQVAKDLKNLSEDIQNGKDELKRTLEEIDSNTCTIKIEHFLGFVKKSSIEETCSAIYSNLSGYIKDCGESIQKTNENLGRSLELIKLLAIVEKDLYEQIDEQVVRGNEFKEDFLLWCKQKGINDDEVRDLLETSFHRAYTLRDRINNLRNESHNSITELDNRVGELETKAQSFKNNCDDFIKLVDEKKRAIDDSYNKFSQTIDKENQECQRRLENAKNSISEIDNRIRLFNEKEQDIKQRLQSFAEDKQKELDKIKTDTKDYLNNFVTQEKTNFTNRIRLFNEKEQDIKQRLQSFAEDKQEELDKIKTDTKDYLNNFVTQEKINLTNICREKENEIKQIIEDCENKFEQEREVLKKSFNKKIMYAVFGAVALSSLISYLVTIILH